MKRSSLIAVSGLLVSGGLLAAGAALPPREPATRPVPPPKVAPQAICPVQGLPGSLVTRASDSLSVTDLSGKTMGSPTGSGAVTVPIRVTEAPGKVLPPGVLVTTPKGASLTTCVQASAASAVQLPDPSVSDVLLVNPDSTDAVVNLSILSDEGDVTGTGARGIVVRPGEARSVPISVLAGDRTSPITVLQSASQGRVLMVGRQLRGTGGLAQNSAQLAAHALTFTGIPAQASTVRLIVGNPGTQRAEVQLKALGADGAFVPAGGESVSVEPRSTISIDLTAAVNAESVGIVLTSDQAVAGTIHVTKDSDAALLDGAEAATSFTDIAAGPALQIANPGSEAAKVTVTSAGKDTRLTIPADASAVLPVRAAEDLVVTSDRPVGASVLISHGGLAVQPLRQTTTAATGADVRQDPTLR